MSIKSSAEKIRQLDVRKEDTMRILFSVEKIFDFDGVDNSQNDRIWAVNREEVNKRDRKKNSKENLQKK